MSRSVLPTPATPDARLSPSASPGTPQLARRALLTGTATVAALGPMAALAVAAPQDDHIFAAIEAHRAANTAYCAACTRKSRFDERYLSEHGTFKDVPDDPFNEVVALCEAERDTAWSLISTVPKTFIGMAAMLRYAREHLDDGDEGLVHDEVWRATFNCSIEDFICDRAGLPTPATAKVLLDGLDEVV